MSTLDQLELVEGFMDFPNIAILYIKVAQVYETQRMKSKFPLLIYCQSHLTKLIKKFGPVDIRLSTELCNLWKPVGQVQAVASIFIFLLALT